MPNDVVLSRLKGIQQQLMGAYEASSPMTSATKGSEREFLVDLFLSNVLPSQYRFGSGDITDHLSNRSGQVDIVVEFPFLPSIPIAGCDRFRLYLAESVACAIEVKSDLSNQWEQALSTCQKLKGIKRSILAYEKSVGGGTFASNRYSQTLTGAIITDRLKVGPQGMEIGGKPLDLDLRIPIFVVGFKGWATTDTHKENLDSSEFDGILNIEKKIYVSGARYSGKTYEGDSALWAFICDLLDSVKELKHVNADPRAYA
ncbi:hypothetical protein BTA51_27910 [Hahella sp. CCB-MM4]|uniref:DUF6602 domain-containing protein n=1 Tax=Hahella sp. (strain CCB-MM4) TaxID=1926491 RepID=UPI000B9ACF89|nr:DUF6602 domain-containing protein [Hahella sp. CCB-MM4]OZG70108.1 hypothetical protein BTA51_27910 [Hahella sp. CCB-MM4]